MALHFPLSRSRPFGPSSPRQAQRFTAKRTGQTQPIWNLIPKARTSYLRSQSQANGQAQQKGQQLPNCEAVPVSNFGMLDSFSSAWPTHNAEPSVNLEDQPILNHEAVPDSEVYSGSVDPYLTWSAQEFNFNNEREARPLPSRKAFVTSGFDCVNVDSHPGVSGLNDEDCDVPIKREALCFSDSDFYPGSSSASGSESDGLVPVTPPGHPYTDAWGLDNEDSNVLVNCEAISTSDLQNNGSYSASPSYNSDSNVSRFDNNESQSDDGEPRIIGIRRACDWTQRTPTYQYLYCWNGCHDESLWFRPEAIIHSDIVHKTLASVLDPFNDDHHIKWYTQQPQGEFDLSFVHPESFVTMIGGRPQL